MRFVDRKETHRHLAQPLKSVSRSQPFRRKIKQPIFPARRFLHHLPTLRRTLKAIDRRRRNAHLRQLRRLVLHQRDQRRNHYRRLPRNHRRKLVAQRLSTASRHHHTSIVRRQQTADNIFLLGAKFVVSPIASQRFRQVWTSIGHSFSDLLFPDLQGSIALQVLVKSVSAQHPICDESAKLT